MPVVGGNVSLYNETEDGPIYPTPVVGMVGELPDPERAGASALRDGDAIALCGPFSPSLAGSELAKLRGELGPGLPSLPIAEVRAAIELVREAVRAGRRRPAPTTSATAASPARWPRWRSPAASGSRSTSTSWSSCAAARARPASSARGRAGSCSPATRAELEALAAAGDVDVLIVGAAGGERIAISAAEAELDVALADAARAWRSLGERMAAEAHT